MPNQSTGYSPYELLFGKPMKMPLDTALTVPKQMSTNHKLFLDELLKKIQVARNLAKSNLESAQKNMKIQHDKTAKVPSLKLGDTVLKDVRKVSKGQTPKFMPKYGDKKYYITEVGPNFTYKLAETDTHKVEKVWINAKRLKKIAERPQVFPNDVAPDQLDNAAEAQCQPPVDTPPDGQPPQPPVANSQSDDTVLSQSNLPQLSQSQRKNVKKINKGYYQSKIKKHMYHVTWEDEDKKVRHQWAWEEDLPSELVRNYRMKYTLKGNVKKSHKKRRM